MATATSFSADTSPAYIEFSQLESWLASSIALQLPLHQIESQQQAKGREVQRLLLQAHLQHRGDGDVGPALCLQQHVLEKLWKAAYVFHPEGSVAAELWVLDHALRILFGDVGQVVNGIRQSITKRGLNGAKRKTYWGSPVTFTETALACTMTNTLPTAGRLPVGRSKARART